MKLTATNDNIDEIDIDDYDQPIPSTWNSTIVLSAHRRETRLLGGVSTTEDKEQREFLGYNITYASDTRDGTCKQYGDVDLGTWLDETTRNAIHRHAPTVTLIIDHGNGRVERAQATYGPVTAQDRAESMHRSEKIRPTSNHEFVCVECGWDGESSYD